MKPLKVLNILDLKAGTTPAELASVLHGFTTQEVAAHLGLLRRLGLAEHRPRQRINGELVPASYRSKRTFGPPYGGTNSEPEESAV